MRTHSLLLALLALGAVVLLVGAGPLPEKGTGVLPPRSGRSGPGSGLRTTPPVGTPASAPAIGLDEASRVPQTVEVIGEVVWVEVWTTPEPGGCYALIRWRTRTGERPEGGRWSRTSGTPGYYCGWTGDHRLQSVLQSAVAAEKRVWVKGELHSQPPAAAPNAMGESRESRTWCALHTVRVQPAS